MNKPSERIVVFVTPAQKRAIAASAEELGISVSELMRRAVLSFGATSEQVKAASIVDRLRAPREPDALNAALERVARGTRDARAALPRRAEEGTTHPLPPAAEPQAAASDRIAAAPTCSPALVRTPEEEQAMAAMPRQWRASPQPKRQRSRRGRRPPAIHRRVAPAGRRVCAVAPVLTARAHRHRRPR